MEPKHLWTLKWSQPYNTEYSSELVKHLRDLYDELVEQCIDDGDFEEANQVIAHIKSKL
jgi:hypothetical protein